MRQWLLWTALILGSLITTVSVVPTTHAQLIRKTRSTNIEWLDNYPTALKEVQKPGERLMLVYFHTDNCIWCNRLEKSFTDSTVEWIVVNNFVPLKLHGNTEIARSMKVSSFPTLLIVDKDRNVIRRHEGSMTALELKEFLFRADIGEQQ